MIHYAIYTNNIHTIDTLLKQGVDITGRTQGNKYTPLIFATIEKNQPAVSKLLHHNKKSADEGPSNFLEMKDKNSRTALVWATIVSDVDILKQLIGNGADVNVEADKALKLTAMHYAAAKGDVDILDTLLRAGADYQRLDKNGVSPVDTAIFYKKASTLEHLLLKYKADYSENQISVDTVNAMFDSAINFLSQNIHKPEYIDVANTLNEARDKHFDWAIQSLEDLNLGAADFGNYYDTYEELPSIEGEDIFYYGGYDDYEFLAFNKRKRRAARNV